MPHLPSQLGSMSQRPLQVRHTCAEVKVSHTTDETHCTYIHTESKDRGRWMYAGFVYLFVSVLFYCVFFTWCFCSDALTLRGSLFLLHVGGGKQQTPSRLVFIPCHPGQLLCLLSWKPVCRQEVIILAGLKYTSLIRVFLRMPREVNYLLLIVFLEIVAAY